MSIPIGAILELILKLLPALLPSELEQLQKELRKKQEEIDKKRKEWENDKKEFEAALADPMDIPAINRILDKWNDQLLP